MNPFRLGAPSVISFSGGRSSGFMLRRVLDAFGGKLPGGIHVVFANTGLEMPGTLDFVRDVGRHWKVPVNWVEYRLNEKDKPTLETVTYETASRDGRPFSLYLEHVERMTRASGNLPYLPGLHNRFCTTELKVRVMKKWMLKGRYDYWTNVVGIRFDEPSRWRKMNLTPPERWDIALPLVEAKTTKAEVLEFWRRQPFDLQLRGEQEGNCDACHLKTAWKVVQVFRDNPERARWWIDWERRTEKRFRTRDYSYEQLLEMSKLPDAKLPDAVKLPVLPEAELKCSVCVD